ncbi:hypothetical protein HAT2_00648 [Candidatus Similichlamydia laticola]|uniref:Uncharacterized protein n=1 Tax=Candidatus Similichlamydia laticola TaxID=2170265 RepID=A0A369K9H5_9BACT|nr:hypothetical protein HAT2_00648 [Candidatus Similichlamydia laticola]
MAPLPLAIWIIDKLAQEVQMCFALYSKRSPLLDRFVNWCRKHKEAVDRWALLGLSGYLFKLSGELLLPFAWYRSAFGLLTAFAAFLSFLYCLFYNELDDPYDMAKYADYEEQLRLGEQVHLPSLGLPLWGGWDLPLMSFDKPDWRTKPFLSEDFLSACAHAQSLQSLLTPESRLKLMRQTVADFFAQRPQEERQRRGNSLEDAIEELAISDPQGEWGGPANEEFERLTPREQHRLTENILTRSQTGASLRYLRWPRVQHSERLHPHVLCEAQNQVMMEIESFTPEVLLFELSPGKRHAESLHTHPISTVVETHGQPQATLTAPTEASPPPDRSRRRKQPAVLAGEDLEELEKIESVPLPEEDAHPKPSQEEQQDDVGCTIT